MDALSIGDTALAWQVGLAGLEVIWLQFNQGFTKVWLEANRKVRKAWMETQQAILKGAEELANTFAGFQEGLAAFFFGGTGANILKGDNIQPAGAGQGRLPGDIGHILPPLNEQGELGPSDAPRPGDDAKFLEMKKKDLALLMERVEIEKQAKEAADIAAEEAAEAHKKQQEADRAKLEEALKAQALEVIKPGGVTSGTAKGGGVQGIEAGTLEAARAIQQNEQNQRTIESLLRAQLGEAKNQVAALRENNRILADLEFATV
jgi:hypothetical protein